MNLSVILFLLCASISGIMGHVEVNLESHGIVPDKESLEHSIKHTHDPYVDMSKLTQDERVIEYFNMFDLDRNGFVDGLESTKKMLDLQLEHKQYTEQELINHLHFDGKTFQEIMAITDVQLDRADKNKDGYISYTEFKTSMNF